MELKIIRVTQPNADFNHLVKELDMYLSVIDEDEHDFYDQFNSVDSLKNIVLAYQDVKPVACGAFKEFDAKSTEIKRMYVIPTERGSGLAKRILEELEEWSREAGYHRCVLETGKRQVEAVKFYQKCGYQIIPCYGQYQGIANSLCFKKHV